MLGQSAHDFRSVGRKDTKAVFTPPNCTGGRILEQYAAMNSHLWSSDCSSLHSHIVSPFLELGPPTTDVENRGESNHVGRSATRQSTATR